MLHDVWQTVAACPDACPILAIVEHGHFPISVPPENVWLQGGGYLPCRITVSSRRSEQQNFALIWLHWTILQVLYWCGVSPNRLARWYQHTRRLVE